MIAPGLFNVGATGGFTYTIPVAVPPGTAGMVPALSLDYSSQAGDGLEGLGWSLSGLPSISRCPRTLAQDGIHGGVNFDANDRFCLEGQRLMALNNGVYGAEGTEYRTEIDGFSRIISHTAQGITGPAWFEVWTKSGQHMQFGHTTDSQAPVLIPPDAGEGSTGGTGSGGGTNTQGASGGSGGTTAPTVVPVVRAWAVNRISDTVGNYLTITYDGNTQDTATGQVYPTRIDYTGNGAAAPYNSVIFVYTTRNAGVPVYQAGAAITNTWLLTHIETYAGAAMVSDYRLAYQFASAGDQHDELSQVKLCDANANCLAPTSFTWQGSRDTLTYTAHANSLAQGLTQSKPNNFIADFNGDGITDAVVLQNQNASCPAANGSIFFGDGSGTNFTQTLSPNVTSPMSVTFNPSYAQNNPDDCTGIATFYTGLTSLFDYDGDGISDMLVEDHDHNSENQYYILHEDSPSHLATMNSALLYDNAAGGQALTGDFDGDGRSDILDQLDATDLNNAYILHSNGDGTFTRQNPIGYDVHDDDSFLYAGDFDGDGCTDLLVQNHDRSSYNEIVYMCSPATPVYAVPFGDWAVDANHTITTGDFNGDGKTDLLLTDSTGAATVYMSTGTKLVSIPNWFYQGTTLIDLTQFTITTGDFDGDGKTDLALVPKAPSLTYPSTLIYLSTGENFIQALAIPGVLGDTDVRAVAADWNNDGASDLWIQNGNGGQDDTEILFHYTPELISAVSNGLGISTYVTYDRLNKNQPFYTKCPSSPATYACGDHWPVQDVDGPLYVVSRVDSSNGLNTCPGPNSVNCYSSSYAYAGGRADMAGRGFEGFSSVTVTDLETGVVQVTNYATQFPYTGMALSQTKTANGAVISVTTNSFADGTGSDCSSQPSGPVYRVYLCRTVVQSWTLAAATGVQGSQLPTVQTDYRNYDSYGNVGQVTASTTPPGGSTPDVTKVTTSTWTNTVDSAHWILGRLTEADVTSSYAGQPSITRHSGFLYDASTGLLTREIVEPGMANTAQWLQTDTGYDVFGNKTSVTVTGCLNAATASAPCSGATLTSCATATTYDTRGEFPTTVANCLGEQESYDYSSAASQAFGQPTSHTGPNHLTTSWSYDSFGRKILQTDPDGTRTSLAYQYCSGVNGGADIACPARGAFSVTAATLGSDGATQTAPGARTFFDGLSRASAADTEAFDSTAAARHWIRTDTLYDSFGRVLRSTRPYFFVPGANPGQPAISPCADSQTVCTTFSYDTLGRTIKTTQADGGYVKAVYSGLVTTVTQHVIRASGAAVNETASTTKNDLGAVASATDPLGGVTSYAYDALGQTLSVTDAMGHVLMSGVAYDQRGRKTDSTDADMGHWHYAYDSFGRLLGQTDAAGDSVAMGYDLLGRMVSRTDTGAGSAAGMVANWTYGIGDTSAQSNQATYPHSAGRLVLATCAGLACGNGDESGVSGSYARAYLFDTLGRESRATITVGTSSFYTTVLYDTISGKPTTVRAFSGFTTVHAYNAVGYESEIDDGTNMAIAYWKANARDAELHLTQQTAANGLITSQIFNPLTGRLANVCATRDAGTCDGAVANQSFTFDTAGTLAERDDTIGQSIETFAYDSANRLTTSQFAVAGMVKSSLAMSYDLTGNITAKSDVGTYSYGSRPHALASVATCTGCLVNGVANPSFAYDANGNMVSGAGRTVAYTAFAMSAQVNAGQPSATTLSYDSEHARVQQVSPVGTTLYLADGGVMTERLTPAAGGSNRWTTYLMADGRMVAQRHTIGSSTSPVMTYFVADHLGSVIATVDDETTPVVTRQSYDPWGRMRNADGTPDTTCALPGQLQSGANVTRGYTGQEQMPAICLDNYNARLYDPTLGRFLAADPSDGSGLNRYWYVADNPLSLNDPTGLCFLGCFWKSPTGKSVLGIAVAAFLSLVALPELEAGITVFSEGGLSSLSAGTLALNSGISGGISGGLTSGRLDGAALGALEAFSFDMVGTAVGDDPGDGFFSAHTGMEFLAHGMVGGLFSAIAEQKGGFVSGFLAAGFGAAADQIDFGGIAGDTAIHAIAGGVGSMLGGGKFANGAVTGAFGYLFNALDHPIRMAGGTDEEEDPRRSVIDDILDPTREIRERAFYSAYEELKQIAPYDRLVTYVSAPGWVPNWEDVNEIEARLSVYRSPLRLLHPESTLTSGEAGYSYRYWSGQSTQAIVNSLRPGEEEPLKVAPGGTIWQGNMRTFILQQRGYDINSLPRTPK